MAYIWQCCDKPPIYIYHKIKGWKTTYCEKHYQLMKDKLDPKRVHKIEITRTEIKSA